MKLLITYFFLTQCVLNADEWRDYD